MASLGAKKVAKWLLVVSRRRTPACNREPLCPLFYLYPKWLRE